MERFERGRLSILIAAFQFWEYADFKSLFNETMEKRLSISSEAEQNQRIASILLEMYKIRRCVNMLNSNPEMAEEYLKREWKQPVTNYRIIKAFAK